MPKVVEGDNLKYPILNHENNRTFAKWIAIKLNWIIGFRANIRRYYKFKHFIENNICTTDSQYNYHSLLSAERIDNLDIETFVCESDVIWKVVGNSTLDENFFLAFPAARHAKKVAYAPTISTKVLNGDLLKKYKTLVSQFYAISAREKAGAQYLKEISGKNVDAVLDPTLLLDADDYNRICIRPQESGYLLIYTVTSNDIEMVKEAKRYAKKRRLKVIEISNYAINRFITPHSVKVGVGIEEWIGYIKYADVVCTNSFHGFCFSILYQKDVYLFQRDNSDYKMQNIAGIMGMGDRLIPYYVKQIPDVEEIDYCKVYENLAKYRIISKQFIDKYITNN